MSEDFDIEALLGGYESKPNIKVDDNQLVLPSGKIITFNSEQYEGINKIREWLKNKKSKFFTLSGFAGVGKSTCIKKIVDEYNYGICVSAPTHKACKVISKFFFIYCKYYTITILINITFSFKITTNIIQIIPQIII